MSGISDSIITTLYNRPVLTLRNVFHALRRQNLKNTEIIVVDDGSTKDYSRIHSYIASYEIPVNWIKINTVEDCPGTYNIDGYNNPSHAWNVGLEAARGDRITMLASDCIIPANAMDRARRCRKSIWMSCVVDMDSGMVYLGKARLAPYGWFMTWRRDVVGEIRQDETYLKGMGFDDNDFTARLALKTLSIAIDPAVTAFHQSHPAIAYSDGHLGHDINERHTWKKWGGIPWSGCETDPLEVTQSRQGDYLMLHVERRELAAAETLREQHAV